MELIINALEVNGTAGHYDPFVRAVDPQAKRVPGLRPSPRPLVPGSQPREPSLSLLRLPRWFRRAPGRDVLARWRVDPALWREFVACEARRPASPAHDEMRAEGEAPPEGFEVVVERDGIWLAGRRIALPVRGTPEVLGAELRDPADAPTTIELSLKHPMSASASGVMRPPTYTRLAVPVPGPAWREARRVVAHFRGDRAAAPDFFHGRGDGADPEDLSRCMHCGFETHR